MVIELSQIVCFLTIAEESSFSRAALRLGMVQSLVGQRMREVAAAAFLLVINRIGLGLGPMVVSMVSDLMTQAYGAQALRYALMATAPVFLIAGLLLASTTLRRDLDNAPA